MSAKLVRGIGMLSVRQASEVSVKIPSALLFRPPFLAYRSKEISSQLPVLVFSQRAEWRIHYATLRSDRL